MQQISIQSGGLGVLGPLQDMAGETVYISKYLHFFSVTMSPKNIIPGLE